MTVSINQKATTKVVKGVVTMSRALPVDCGQDLVLST